MPSRLSALQVRVLEALTSMQPTWTLTGGGALALHPLQHRKTHGLDLHWQGERELGPIPREVEALLARDGLRAELLTRGAAFVRMRVSDLDQDLIVDLVADPVPTLEQPTEVACGERSIRVDSAHEILVNKLAALLSRSETRDLVDVRALLLRGGDLERALVDAPSKDGGFSTLALCEVLRSLPLESSELDPDLLSGLEEYREELLDRLTRGSAPDTSEQGV